MKHFMLPRNAVLRDAQQQTSNESTMSNYSPNPSSSKSKPLRRQKSAKENVPPSDLNALLSSDHNKTTLKMKSPLPPRPLNSLKRELNMEAVPENSIPTGSDYGVKVTSPYGNNLHHNKNVTHGQFAFTTTEAGNYLACFWMDKSQGGEMTLSLDWRIGVAAKDWESIARK